MKDVSVDTLLVMLLLKVAIAAGFPRPQGSICFVFFHENNLFKYISCRIQP